MADKGHPAPSVSLGVSVGTRAWEESTGSRGRRRFPQTRPAQRPTPSLPHTRWNRPLSSPSELPNEDRGTRTAAPGRLERPSLQNGAGSFSGDSSMAFVLFRFRLLESITEIPISQKSLRNVSARFRFLNRAHGHVLATPFNLKASSASVVTPLAPFLNAGRYFFSF